MGVRRPGGNSRDRTILVAEKAAPNPWSLHDIHGNVWEWVADRYGQYSGEEQRDPVGPPGGKNRVIRGGSFRYPAEDARSANRDWNDPRNAGIVVGFRVVFPAAPSD